MYRMSIVISGVSYRYPNCDNLFDGVNLSVGDHEKVALVAGNGSGKSTLLKLVAGILQPEEGSVALSSPAYYVPQNTGMLCGSIAGALGVEGKIKALEAIAGGSVSQSDYDALSDDWDVETRCREALSYWRLPELYLHQPVDLLSGGEKSKLFLAGMMIHQPGIILMDEPTNHLDRTTRGLLYEFIDRSRASMLIVSHDITLLERMNISCELSPQGIKRYGGNYSFYREQKALQADALDDNIKDEEKTLRLAQKHARETARRQERRTASQGEKNKMQVPRIMRNTLRDSSERTAAKLGGRHEEIITESREKLSALRRQRGALKDLKINLDDTPVRHDKLLIEARGVNVAWDGGEPLWRSDIDLRLYSHDRLQITGDNGSGKTTLVKLLTGAIEPSRGSVGRQQFDWLYLDQDYSMLDGSLTVGQIASQYNLQNMEAHEVNLRLNRYFFPAGMWDRKCSDLSGGEKMRLCLCLLTISNQAPALVILDEPTNNLDIGSVEILTCTIKEYEGSLLVISHDDHFIDQAGITGVINLERRE